MEEWLDEMQIWRVQGFVKKLEEAAETCCARWFVTQSHLGTLCWKHFVKGQGALKKIFDK